MAQSIVEISQMGDALRNTGYKSTENAVAEIVDNSIEANAKDVLIIITETIDSKTNRLSVTEIAVFDNGYGMDEKTLGGCLGIGVSTRRKTRKGMGRFGVGLPQASLHCAPAVDVFSWQGGYDNCEKVSLDIEKVTNGEQELIDDPTKQGIPSRYEKYLEFFLTSEKTEKFFCKESGTLVQWKRCDRVIPKTRQVLEEKLKFTLGQKYRHFIKDGICNIYLVNSADMRVRKIMPNDPLFLMEGNCVMGNPSNPGKINPFMKDIRCTETLFEPFSILGHEAGVINVPVKYISEDGKRVSSTVKISFSKVKDIFYDKTAMAGNPGGTDMGQFVKKLEGISIVRANREIDFGKFDFYSNINEPEHRWWGCEISFEPELDKAFGVANNKQYVDLKSIDPLDYEDDEVLPMWAQLHSIVSGTIKQMYKGNKDTRAKTRTVEGAATDASKIVNQVEAGNAQPNLANEYREKMSEEELLKKNTELLKEIGVNNPTKEAVLDFAKNKVVITYKSLGSASFFDYKFTYGLAHIAINTDHVFYVNFLSKIMNSPDSKTAFELFLSSLVMVVNETNIDPVQAKKNDYLMQKWNQRLWEYITKQLNYGE